MPDVGRQGHAVLVGAVARGVIAGLAVELRVHGGAKEQVRPSQDLVLRAGRHVLQDGAVGLRQVSEIKRLVPREREVDIGRDRDDVHHLVGRKRIAPAIHRIRDPKHGRRTQGPVGRREPQVGEGRGHGNDVPIVAVAVGHAREAVVAVGVRLRAHELDRLPRLDYAVTRVVPQVEVNRDARERRFVRGVARPGRAHDAVERKTIEADRAAEDVVAHIPVAKIDVRVAGGAGHAADGHHHAVVDDNVRDLAVGCAIVVPVGIHARREV